MADATTLEVPPTLQVSVFGLTDKGKTRAVNEDQFLIAEMRKAMHIWQTSLPGPSLQTGDEAGHLFLVADGMGGHKAGEEASALAVAAVEHFTVNRLKWFFNPDQHDAEPILADFKAALRQADSKVIEEAEQNPALAGMGTTLTLAYHLHSRVCVVHVGDSRAYLFRRGELRQLTSDHTLIAELVRRGDLTPEQASTHRLRKVITNVVGGGQPGVHVEALAIDLEPDDTLLLCSDGLTEMLTNDQIAQVLTSAPGEEAACRALVDGANAAGGKDNITAIVARFRAPAA